MDRQFITASLASLVFVAFILFMRFGSLSTGSDAVAYLCEPSSCTVQAWLSALSGVAGTIVAGVGAYLVLAQLGEIRRQNAYLLGDVEPEFEICAPANHEKNCVFKLTNWNRRAVALSRIQICVPQLGNVDVTDISKTEEYYSTEVLEDGGLQYCPSLPGWHHRQDAPPNMSFTFSLAISMSEYVLNNRYEQCEVIFTTMYPPDRKQTINYTLLVNAADLFLSYAQPKARNAVV